MAPGRSSRPGQGALQELDQRAILAPITKWSAVCTQPDRIADHVATAFRHALAQPRGPVYLELPMDVLFADAAPDVPERSRSDARAFGDPREVMKAADLLDQGRAAGGDRRHGHLVGRRLEAAPRLRRERPAARSSSTARGAARCRPSTSSSSSMPVGGRSPRPTSICVIGTPLDFRLKFGRFPDGTKLVHVHADADGARPEPRARRRDRRRLRRRARHPRGRRQDPATDREAWLAALREADQAWWDEHRAEIESDSAPLHHYRLAAELDRVLDPDTIVIGDGGDVVAAVSRVLRVHKPGHWLDPGPFGCLGVGPPYALGVKAARPDKQVVVVAGDGAFGLNGFEFETLDRLGMPAVFVIGNDAAWGEIRIPQIGLYGEEGEVATRLAPTPLRPPHGGASAAMPSTWSARTEIAPALERALAAGAPAIVNVMLDPDAMAGHAYRGYVTRGSTASPASPPRGASRWTGGFARGSSTRPRAGRRRSSAPRSSTACRAA